jgi:DNA polymerase epsilon subunit 2
MISDTEIIQILKGHGIKIRPTAFPLIKKQFLAVSSNESECERLIEKWSKFEILDTDHLQETEDHSSRRDQATDIFVIDVFAPDEKRSFNQSLRSFTKSREASSYLNPVQGKSQMYHDRFLSSIERIKQHELQTSSKPSSLVNTIDSLIGCSSEKIIVGILSKNDSNSWILEDLTRTIRLSIYDIEKTGGFFCEGCIVLVQGRNVDDLFNVSCIAQPPVRWLECEKSSPSEKWTIPWPEHSLIVFLSNVHLDEGRVLTLLDKLFAGYSEFSNVMFVFIGNFSSQKEPDPYKYPGMFEDLVNLVLKYEKLAQTAMWVFVPGPSDPGLGEFLPRQAIPKFFVESLENLNKWKMASNPSRILFCGKEILIGRVEQIRKMQRNSACDVNLEQSIEPEFHLAQTVLRQMHLSPTVHNLILPDFDHALRIDRKIEFLCLAENGKGFRYDVEGVVVFNPGHFSRYATFFVLTGKDLEGELCDLDG